MGFTARKRRVRLSCSSVSGIILNEIENFDKAKKG